MATLSASLLALIPSGSALGLQPCEDLVVTELDGGSGLVAAIEQSNSCLGAQTIAVEPGRYEISSTLILSDELTIASSEPLRPVTLHLTAGGTALSANGNRGPFTIRDLTVTAPERSGLLFARNAAILLERVTFQGAASTCGVSTPNAVQGDNIELQMTTSSISGAGCSGLAAFNGSVVTLDDVDIFGNGGDGMLIGGSVTMSNSHIYDNGGFGITTESGPAIEVIASHIFGNGSGGISQSSGTLAISSSTIGLTPSLGPAGNGGIGLDVSAADIRFDVVEIAHNNGGMQIAHAGGNTTNVRAASVHDNLGSGVHLSSGAHRFSDSSITSNETDCTFGTGTFQLAEGNTDSDRTCGFGPPNEAPSVVLPNVEVDEGSGPVTLDASASTDPDGDELTFAWSSNVIPSGNQASLADTVNDGEHTVTVEVCDDSLACATATAFVTVHNVAPQLQLSGPTEWTTNFSESIVFEISDQGVLDTHSATIDWGDESSVTINDVATRTTAEHVYTAPGTFIISVEVQDDGGGYATATLAVMVSGPPAPSGLKLSASLQAEDACLPPATDVDGVATTNFTLPAGWSQGSPEVFYCLIVINNSADSISRVLLNGDHAALEGFYELDPPLAAGESRIVDLGGEFGATGSLRFDVTLFDQDNEVDVVPVAISVDAPSIDGAVDSWTTAGSSAETACNDQFGYDDDGDAVGVASVPEGITEMWLCVSMRNNANGTLMLHDVTTDPALPSDVWPGHPFAQSADPGDVVRQIIGPVLVELGEGALETVHSVAWRSLAPPDVVLFADLSSIRFVPIAGEAAISIEPASSIEGSAANPGELEFTLTLRSPAGEPVVGPASVLVQTDAGSATAGQDYTPSAELIDFATSAVRTFTVQIVGDEVAEPDEQVTILLSQVTGAVLTESTTTGLIIDDDGELSPALTVRIGRSADSACGGELELFDDGAIGRLQLPVGGSAAMPLFYCVTYRNDTAQPQTPHLLHIDGMSAVDLPFSAESFQLIEPGGQLTRIVGPLALSPSGLDETLTLAWTWRAFGTDNSVAEAHALTEVAVAEYTGDLLLEASIWNAEPPADCDLIDQQAVTTPFGQGPGSSSFQAWYCLTVTNAGTAALISNQLEFETDGAPRRVPVPGVLVASERRTIVVGPLTDHPSGSQGGIFGNETIWSRAIAWIASGPGYVPGLDDHVVAQAGATVTVVESNPPDLVRLEPATVIEGQTVAIDLTRGPDLTETTAVYLATKSATATGALSCDAGVDFIIEPGLLVDLNVDGELPSFEIATCNDEVPEPNDRLVLGVYTVGDGDALGERLTSVEITILDDGDIVRLDVVESDDLLERFVVSIPLAEPAETDTGYRMLLTGDVMFGPVCGTGNDVTWGPVFNPNTPNEPDFTVETGAVAMEFEVSICGDGYPEPTESATIHVVDNESGDEIAQWALTIEDEDPFPVLRGVAVDDEWEDLGVADSAYARFEIITAAEVPWPFDLSITGPGAGLCGFGANFQPPVIPIVIVDFSEDEFELPVGSCRDADIEDDYTVDVQLVARDTYADDQDMPAVSRVDVHDDDEPPQFAGVTQLSVDEGSGGGTTRVGVSLPVLAPTRAPDYRYRVRSALGLGLAIEGANCDPFIGVLGSADHLGVVGGPSVRTLERNQDTLDFEIELCADTELEPNRVAWFEIWDDQDVRVIASVAILIVDDDGTPVIRLFDAEVLEGTATNALPGLIEGLPTDIDELPTSLEDLPDLLQPLVTTVDLRLEILEPPQRDYTLSLMVGQDADDTAVGPSGLRPFCDPLLIGPPDYAWTPRSVVVSPDDAGSVIEIRVFGACADLLIEGDETYSVRVIGELGAVLDDATVTIIDDDAAPVIEIADIRVAESVGTVDIEVDVQTPVNIPAWVRFIDGTATRGTNLGADYQTPNNLPTVPLQILPGDTGTSIIPIDIVDDDRREVDEFFAIEVWDSPVGGNRLSSARVTIEDDDRPPQIRIVDLQIVEGTAVEFFPGFVAGLPTSLDDLENFVVPPGLFSMLTPGTIEVRVVDAPLRPYTLTIEPSTGPGDTAIGLSNAVPFCDPSGLLGVPDFFWDDRELEVRPSDEGEILELDVYIACADSAIEDDETYSVRALDEAFNVIDDATVTIIDDDFRPTLTGIDVTVEESVVVAQVTFDVHTPANIPLWVRTRRGTAGGADFVADVVTPLLITPGATGPAFANVAIHNDDLPENSETFTVEVWDALTGGTQLAAAVVTILDNDRAPVIQLLDVEVIEGSFTNLPSNIVDPRDQLLTRGMLRIRVTEAPLRPYTVTIETLGLSSDTAVGLASFAPCDLTGLIGVPDYQWSTKHVAIYPDDQDQVIEAEVALACADLLIEGDEFYTIRAFDEQEVTLDTATITIIDDDVAPEIATSDIAVSESVGLATIIFDVTSPVQVPVFVRTVSESAKSGAPFGDFGAVASLPLPSVPGATGPVEISVAILDDGLVESDETFRVEVWDAPLLGNRLATSTVTILDDDRAPSIELLDVEVVEGSLAVGSTQSLAQLRLLVTNAPLRPYDISIEPLGLSSDTAVGMPEIGLGCDLTGLLGLPDYAWSAKHITVTPSDQGNIVQVEAPLACRDIRVEDDEVYTIRAFGEHREPLDTATITILNDDTDDPIDPVIVAPETTNLAEGAIANLAFDVQQIPPLGLAVVIGFESITGNTTNGLCPFVGPGADALVLVGPAAIPAGSTSFVVPVVACHDSHAESTERFYVTLSLVDGTELARAQVRVIDNDSSSVSIADAWVVEGDSGQKNVTLTVNVSGPDNTPVDVSWSAKELSSSSSLSAADSPSDFDARTGSLSFSQPGSKQLTVPIYGDTDLEGDEWFRVTISSQAATVADGSALVRIADDEALVISIGDAANILEGDAGTAPLIFPVTISQAPVNNVTVGVATHDLVDSVLVPDATDFATPGEHFTSLSLGIVFSPGGPLTQFVEVPVVGNTILEDDRSVYLIARTFTAANAVVESGSGRGYIFDDDDAPVIHGANNIYVTLNSAGLAMRVYYEPTGTDIQDFTVPVTCDPESGSFFPLGTTQVTCSAVDSSGQTATDSFQVVIAENDFQKVAIPQGPDIRSAIAGDTIQFVAGGFAAHSRVELELRSTPISLGAALADARGVIDVVVTIPHHVPDGEHTLIARGKDPAGRSHQAIQAIYIGANGPPPTFTG